MRIHRLEITAFGPFAGTECIDFDALNDAGFFLLTGPTGAGKTSVLDAICFGLFGAVPGVRNNAKDLKSHHAGPRDQPLVELELTLRDRRLRLRRTPAWRRPSTRAKSGFVDENASVSAVELVDGAWVSRGTRLDEVGHLVAQLIGMNKEQFCQVAMLPQGQFETFLRAGAKERHDVLEALFHTGRFQQMEKWLAEHRRRTEAAARAHESQIDVLLARAEEANGQRWYDDETGAVAVVAELVPVVDRLEESTDALRTALSDASAAAKAAEHAVSEAELLSHRQGEHARARRDLNELDSVRSAVEARAAQIARARLADKLVPVLELLDEASERYSDAAALQTVRFAAAEESGAFSDSTTTPQSARAAADRLRTELARLHADAGIDVALDDARVRLVDLEATLRSAEAELADAQEATVALPGLLLQARRERDRASLQAASVAGLEVGREAARRTHQAAAALPGLRASLTQARDAERAAHSRQLDARTTAADLREARIEGMAAQLASELRPGSDCPVCGSVEHPRPAKLHTGHVTEADERASEVRLRDADRELADARERVADLAREVELIAAAAAGLDEPTAEAALRSADGAVESARAAKVTTDELAVRIGELEDRQRIVDAVVLERLQARDALVLERDHARRRIDELEAKRRDLLPDAGTVTDAIDRLGRRVSAIDAWLESLAGLRAAESALDTRRTAFLRGLDVTTFTDEADLRSAVMTAPDVATAEALNRKHADQRAAALSRLDDPQLAQAAECDPPDLDALRAAAQKRQVAHQVTAERYRREAHRYERLVDLSAELHAAVDAWAPLRAAYELATEVAAMCAGTSPDNQTRTRLSHYVLAARLQQVVAAANARLLGISAGRYQLLHTMLKGVGDTRGGLGLRVLDTYTGQERDPATLSGGETFYVSLALALGLADLVRDEIGGTELSTLFVDEGFGSLDAETLDEVLDEVDTLRSGGRSVGLVSHLDELRRRIPTQIRIVTSHHGSTVSLDAGSASPVRATSHA